MRALGLLLLLAGCPYVGSEGQSRVEDLDGDGVVSIRFGGRDCDDNDSTVGDCDLDQDGFRAPAFGGDDCDDTDGAINPSALERCDGIDNDCDGAVDDEDTIPSELQLSWYPDADGDGFGEGDPLVGCVAPAGFVDNALDCDDSNDSVNPVALEACDAIDHDCDGDPNEGAADEPFWYEDVDGDGYGGVFIGPSCEGPVGAVSNGDDCDDSDPLGHPVGSPPDSTEVCDGVDNDCDGLIDDADPDLDLASRISFYVDADGDSFGAAEVLACAQPSGAVLDGGDCDDANPMVSPAAAEVCGGVDDDCDGQIDAADTDLVSTIWYLDEDGDGVGQPGVTLQQCGQPAGYVAISGDCNDFDPLISDVVVFYPDLDEDGFGDGAGGASSSCIPPLGFVRNSGDCDDSNPDLNPAAVETCDGVDNDCDGLVDDDPVGSGLWYLDGDVDGFGSGLAVGPGCAPDDGQVWTQTAGDCDDTDGAVNPAAFEVCNGFDDDCDGLQDDEDSSTQLDRWYRDTDGDGRGREDIYSDSCTAPAGFVADGTDCNDLDPIQFWDLVEIPGDVATIAEAAPNMCPLGVILLDPAVEHPLDLTVTLPMTLASSDGGFMARLVPAQPTGSPIRIPSFSALFLEDVEIVDPGIRTEPFVVLDTLGFLSIASSTIQDITQDDSGFIAGEVGTVVLQDVQVDNIRADRGLVNIGLGTISMANIDVTSLDSQAPSDSLGPGSLLRTSSASTLTIDGLSCTDCTGPGLINLQDGFIRSPQYVVNSVFVDSPAPWFLNSTFTLSESSFVDTGPVADTLIRVGTAGDVSVLLSDFEGTGGMESEGVLRLQGVALRGTGSPTSPVLHSKAVFLGLSAISVDASVIADPAGIVKNRALLQMERTRIVRAGASGPWLDATGVFATDTFLRNSIVSEAITGITANTISVHNSAFMGGADAFDSVSALGAQISHNLFIDTEHGLGFIPCSYCMYTGGFAFSDPDPLVVSGPYLSYSLDIDPEFWLPILVPPASAQIDSGASGWDSDGSDGDRGILGGPVGDPLFMADVDGDGLWDGWDDIHVGFSLVSGDVVCEELAAGSDCDGDGLMDEQEQAAGTWPSVVDTDGDGTPDGVDLDPLND